MSASMVFFIKICGDKVGCRMLWDQSPAWIYSAYMVGCVKQSFIMPNVCNCSGFACGEREDRIRDLSCMEYLSICQLATKQMGRGLCAAVHHQLLLHLFLATEEIHQLLLWCKVSSCMMILLCCTVSLSLSSKTVSVSQGVFYLKIKVCCVQRTTWDVYLWNPVALASCPSLQVKANWVTWGVLMFLAGFVGDARQIMAMLSFTGVC